MLKILVFLIFIATLREASSFVPTNKPNPEDVKPGFYFNQKDKKIEQCEVGTYSSLYNSFVCHPCTAKPGFYCPAGSISRWGMPCEAGYFNINTNGSTCTKCAPGTFSAAKSSDCSSCPRNTYAVHAGSTVCLPCAPGFKTRNVGATGCIKI